MDNMISYIQSRLVDCKESTAKWQDVKSSAWVVWNAMDAMVQALAEADSEKLLKDKRAELDVIVVANVALMGKSLEVLRKWHGSAELAERYNQMHQWYATLAGARSFKDWEECRTQVLVHRTYAYSHYQKVVVDANRLIRHFSTLVHSYQKDISTFAAHRLQPVALSKAVRKEAVRNAIMPHTLVPNTVAACSNSNLYSLARYHLGRNGTRELRYGFRLTYKIWSHALAIRSMFPRA